MTKQHSVSWGNVFHGGDAATAFGKLGTVPRLPGCRREKLLYHLAYSQPKFHYANLI